MSEPKKKNRGFRLMSPNKRKHIASLGGVAAHVAGAAHEYTSEEARAAGRLGGAKIAKDRAHMSAIGRLGGLRRVANIRAEKADLAAQKAQVPA